MNETSIIRPWQPAPAPKALPRPSAAIAAETDERLMMARLFGKTSTAMPARETVHLAPASDDEFAPNLGRHVDVIA